VLVVVATVTYEVISANSFYHFRAYGYAAESGLESLIQKLLTLPRVLAELRYADKLPHGSIEPRRTPFVRLNRGRSLVGSHHGIDTRRVLKAISDRDLQNVQYALNPAEPRSSP
jgi:hypothetical protein